MEHEYVAETFEHNGYTVQIIADNDASNPRIDYDNAGTMACWHRKYNLGDKEQWGRRDEPSDFLDSLAEEFSPGFADRWDNSHFRKMVPGDDYYSPAYKERKLGWQRARAAAMWKIIHENYVILPLALIDHSGISMWVGSGAHQCDPGGWDSGQVGWIYCDRRKAVEEWGKTKFTSHVRKMAEKWLRQEVETYDQYLTGDVYGYVITDPDGNEKDSCWGMFGLDYCTQEAKDAVPDEPALKGGESEDKMFEATLA